MLKQILDNNTTMTIITEHIVELTDAEIATLGYGGRGWECLDEDGTILAYVFQVDSASDPVVVAGGWVWSGPALLLQHRG